MAGRRTFFDCVSFVVIAALIISTGPATPVTPVPPTSQVSITNSQALVQPLFSFTRPAWTSNWRGLRQLAAWHRGDAVLLPLRKPYAARLRLCLALLVTDAVATLSVPYIGQALYDTAAQGASVEGSFALMAGISSLLVMVEGLDPLRRYLQFRLTEVNAGFVADVRRFLLERALQHPAAPLPGLIYLHAPAFAVRNIEVPLKLPLTVLQMVISSVLLWRQDPVVLAVACLTALILVAWSHYCSRSLAAANAALRQAEADAMALLSPSSWEPQHLNETIRRFDAVRRREIDQTVQGLWYDGVADRLSTLLLMTGVMLWGTWHQYWMGSPSSGQILTLLALAWNVQYRISSLMAIAKRRLEAESASFLLNSPAG